MLFPHGSGLFYIYDTGTTAITIEARRLGCQPRRVFLDDETIAVLAWRNLDLRPWRQKLRCTINSYPDIKAVAWSPDATKVAWITQDKVTVFDLTTATELVILEADDEELLAVAWSATAGCWLWPAGSRLGLGRLSTGSAGAEQLWQRFKLGARQGYCVLRENG